MAKHTEEFSHLTFSQREGLVPIPGPLKLGELSDDLRYELWQMFQKRFLVNELKQAFARVTELPLCQVAELDNLSFFGGCENLFLSGKYNQVLDFLELNLKILDAGNNYHCTSRIKELFSKYQAAYTLIHFKNRDQWNFHPITSEANRVAVQQDLATVEEAGYEAAIQHFINASKAIKENNFRLAVAESHSATEAVARDMTGESTLGTALRKLKSDPNLDNTLITGIDKITAYAHQHRHGKEADSKHVPVGQDEAILMFSINAAIAGYLSAKARKEKE